MPGHAGLAGRPARPMACHQSAAHTETHVTHQLSYSQHFEAGANGAAASNQQVLDVSDPNGNAVTLLRNVESVYFQSMTSEDEKNKMLRQKMHDDDQIHRLRREKEDLSRLLTQEKTRRTTDSSLSQELVKNEHLMKDILAHQQDIKVRRRHTSQPTPAGADRAAPL